MSTMAGTARRMAALHAVTLGGLRYDWLMSCLGLIFTGGLYLDGWAHNHGRVDESFFTPWHAFLYGAYGVVALLLVGTLLFNRSRGRPIQAALPAGYSLSLLGVMLFGAGGVGDLIWHELFGIEESLEALFSPTHLMLGLGMGLVVTGPLAAAWQRDAVRLTWRTAGPALLSLLSLLSVLTFFTLYAHPLAANIAGARHHTHTESGQIAGTASVLLMTVVLMGPVLLALVRWQLPRGGLLLVWGVNTVAMAVVNWHSSHTRWLLLAMVGAVVASEVLYGLWRPHVGPRAALRRFAFAAPLLLMGSYFGVLLMTEGTLWSVHMWAGVVVEAALVGWLLSYMVLPPILPNVNSDFVNPDFVNDDFVSSDSVGSDSAYH